MKPIRNLLLLGLVLLFQQPALALLDIEITQGVEGALPIAVLDFTIQTRTAISDAPADVIRSDLYRSGQFETKQGTAPLEETSEYYKTLIKRWRSQGTDYLVTGKVEEQGADRYRVEFRLFDTLRGEQLLGRSTLTNKKGIRLAAHKISNHIYEKLLGIRGDFDTRVAYITVEGKDKNRRYELQIADADGHNPRTVFSSDEPIMSPAWSADSKHLAYVSFEGHRASIYIQELATGKRQKVSSQKGINGAPAWSPDGKKLAIALSKDGNPEIYILDVGSRQLTRITRNRAIDTEPVWTPDGKSLIFTSDRSGSPQLYRKLLRGGKATRLTYEGSYNSDPDITSDGRYVAMVHRGEGGFHIAVKDQERGLLNVLTQGRLDEAPSLSPNGSMIIYATEDRGRGVLAAVSVDGRVKQVLRLHQGEVREPAWSGYSDRSTR